MIISKILILLIIACARQSNSLMQSFHCTQLRYLPLHLCSMLVLVEILRKKLKKSWNNLKKRKVGIAILPLHKAPISPLCSILVLVGHES